MTSTLLAAPTSLNLSAFDDAMPLAIEAAQVGFYFEEGGCWGFAHALHARLTALGLAPQLVYRPSGFVHAWVQLDGHNLDYRGVFRAAPGAQPLRDAAELADVARTLGGTSGEGYLSDIADADRVLDAVFNQLTLNRELLPA